MYRNGFLFCFLNEVVEVLQKSIKYRFVIYLMGKSKDSVMIALFCIVSHLSHKSQYISLTSCTSLSISFVFPCRSVPLTDISI